MTITTEKKITLSTLKSFVRKNSGRILVKVTDDFDSSVDGVRPTGDNSFTPARPSNFTDSQNLGIAGIHLVLSSRDYFRSYSDGQFEGISVSNCCGAFTLAIKKEVA